jgi:hypothetical protein
LIAPDPFLVSVNALMRPKAKRLQSIWNKPEKDLHEGNQEIPEQEIRKNVSCATGSRVPGHRRARAIPDV